MKAQLVQDRNVWVLWAENGFYRTYALSDEEEARKELRRLETMPLQQDRD
jgi:hypothetical protein